MPIQRSKTPEAEEGHNDEGKGRFYQTAFAPCIVFLPTERMIVPEALRYEMMRSSGMPENSRNKRLEYWFDWTAVDSKIVLYFILYLNHSKIGNYSKKRSAIERLTELIKTDDTIVHKETALNLRGWVFKQERCMEKAAVCFEASLQLHETHTAAAQHLKDLKPIMKMSQQSFILEKTINCETKYNLNNLLNETLNEITSIMVIFYIVIRAKFNETSFILK